MSNVANLKRSNEKNQEREGCLYITYPQIIPIYANRFDKFLTHDLLKTLKYLFLNIKCPTPMKKLRS